MDIKYYTPKLEAGKWNFQLPTHQRTTGNNRDAMWIFLPEGIHTIQVTWQGSLPADIGTRRYGTTGSTRVLKEIPASLTSPVIAQVVVDAEGAEIVLRTKRAISEADLIPPAVIHAGVTVFLGTNEPPA